MIRAATIGVLAALLALLAGCAESQSELRLHMPHHSTVNAIALRNVFEQQSGGVAIVESGVAAHRSGLEALASGEADLALVENSSTFVDGVRIVLPLYRSVLHILVSDDIYFEDNAQPLRDRDIFIRDNSPAGKGFIEIAATRQGLTPDQLRFVDVLEPGVTDFIIYFGPINPWSPDWYVPGYHLYSLDYDDSDSVMSARAMGYLFPHVEPETIPAHTYNLPGNERDIQTLAVDTLLATQSTVSEQSIYRVTKTLLEQKARFTAVSPELFSGMTESFDPLSLNFPLHSGARRYLARDEPSTLERYAESINLLMYVFFLVVTGTIALMRLHSRRKKDRIDEFYSRIMAIRMRAMSEPHGPLLLELQRLELEAFESLIGEKLAADESFRIFIELLTRAINELDTPGSSTRTTRN